MHFVLVVLCKGKDERELPPTCTQTSDHAGTSGLPCCGFFLHESAEETPICSPGSDGVVNSFKNSERTKKTETQYLCPAVIFAFGCV